jgi:uncharacterized membrane protein
MTKRELGFAISVLGYGVVAIIGLLIIGRPTHVNDPTLDGPERFAVGLGEAYVNAILAFVAFLVSFTCGSIGAYLGSRAGKTLLILMACFTALFFMLLFLESVLQITDFAFTAHHRWL